MEDMLISKLTSAGLVAKEARVYVTALLLGKATLIQIARKAEMDHVTVYYYLKLLQDKKLIDKQTEGKQKYYHAYNPRHAFREFEREMERDLERRKNFLMEAIDGFDVIYDSLEAKPEVKFFQGDEAKKMLQNEVRNTSFEQMYEFVNLDDSYKYTPPKRGDHRKRFRRLGLKSKSIYTSERGATVPEKIRNCYHYFIPKDKFFFNGEISSFKDKIIFYTDIPGKAGVLITNKSFAEALQRLFELALESVDKYKSKPNHLKHHVDSHSYDSSPSPSSEKFQKI